MDDLSTWQLLRDGRFVLRIAASPVVRKQSYFMFLCKMPENVEGTYFASGIDRQKLSCLDPEYFHFPVRLAALDYQHIPS